MDKEILNDPQMHRRLQSKLSDKMNEILRLCGYSLFVELLQVVDDFSVDNGKGNVVRFPRPSIVFNIDRNDYIFTLRNKGMSIEEIRSLLIRELGIELCPRHISHIVTTLRRDYAARIDRYFSKE